MAAATSSLFEIVTNHGVEVRRGNTNDMERMTLPDVIQEGLHAVFCGTAVSDASMRAQAFYAGPGNRFWPTLHETGLTATLIRPANYRLILSSRLGLTDLVKSRSGSDSSLRPEDFNVQGFRAKIRDYAPVIVAFNGKKAAQIALDRAYVDFGLQNEGIHGAAVWVLPSTARTANGPWDPVYWQALADAVTKLKGK
jgi:TDG/mug DNA glycosylase family protein